MKTPMAKSSKLIDSIRSRVDTTILCAVLAFLVIYHEIRDFELDPRDKNFCSVTSHEPLKIRDFGKFPKKLGKSSNFAQKVIISVTKNQK